MFSNFSHPRPSIIQMLVFVVLFLLGYWILLVPKLDALAHQTAILEAQKQVSTDSSSSSTKMSAQAQANANTILLATELIPSESRIYDLTVQLEAMARNSGTTLTNLNVSSAATSTTSQKTTSSTATQAATAADPILSATTGLTQVTINLSASGSYTALKGLVDSVTKLKRYIVIQGVTFTGGAAVSGSSASPSPTTTTTGSAQLSAQINAVAYAQTNP